MRVTRADCLNSAADFSPSSSADLLINALPDRRQEKRPDLRDTPSDEDVRWILAQTSVLLADILRKVTYCLCKRARRAFDERCLTRGVTGETP
jgi:hypothetical protein